MHLKKLKQKSKQQKLEIKKIKNNSNWYEVWRIIEDGIGCKDAYGLRLWNDHEKSYVE